MPLVIPIAGGQFNRLYDSRGGLVQGMRLRLRREDNAHDANCVGIYLTAQDLIDAELPIPYELAGDPRPEWKLGYVPQKTTEVCWSAIIGPKLDAGAVIDCFYAGITRGDVLVRLEGEAADQAAAEGEATVAERQRREREREIAHDADYWSHRIWRPSYWGDDPAYISWGKSRYLRSDGDHKGFRSSLERWRERRRADIEEAFGVTAQRQRDKVRRGLRRDKKLLQKGYDGLKQSLLDPTLTGPEAERLKRLAKGVEQVLLDLEAVVPTSTRRRPKRREPEPEDWRVTSPDTLDDDIPF